MLKTILRIYKLVPYHKKNKTPVNANTEQINPLFALIDSDTEINYISVEKSSMQSAINAQNKRKPKRKKR